MTKDKSEAEICTGCGTTRTLEEVQSSGALSCCPDRRMVPARDVWRSEYEARAKVAELEQELREARRLG